MASKELQASALPDFTESELLGLLATLGDDVGAENVKIEEKTSVWDPSVNVILDGDVFALEKNFETFADLELQQRYPLVWHQLAVQEA
ncbi:hypothetical protein V7S43_011530 [Phytophthora oleae]|uniref:Uncharacterized protein n=1 Tax=Phytophthora oleae TaxID=2107226 RepID=A0ABD3FBH8_9STRA